MNPIFKMLLDALLKYLSEHPDELQQLIDALVKAIIDALQEAEKKKG